jgi:DNA repair exonuclease SbcCD nuclease subunit
MADDTKFITFTDVHISDINPQARLGDYRQDILDKLNQIKDAGEKLKVDFFLCAGDMFNLKAPMKNSHELTGILIKLFKSFPAPVYCIEGNHDLKNDSYLTFDKQPLNVIYKSGALIQIGDEKRIKNIRLRSFLFTEDPYLESTSAYPRAIDDEETVNVCALHLYATKNGGSLFKFKLYSYEEIAQLNDDIFVLGHYHIDQGVEVLTTRGKEQHFINVGAISRGSLVEDDIGRSPKVCLVTVSPNKKISTQVVKLKVKPATEVFNIEEKKTEKERAKATEEFVDTLKLEVTGNTIITKDNIQEEISRSNVEKVIVQRVTDYLNEADRYIKGILT